MKLNQLNHKSIIGAGNPSSLFHKAFCFFIVKSIHEYQVSYNKSNGTRNSLNAVNEHIFLVSMSCVYEIDHPIKKTLYIFILGVFEEKSEIVIFWRSVISWVFNLLKPIFTIIPCTVHNLSYTIFLKDLLIFCYFFS